MKYLIIIGGLIFVLVIPITRCALFNIHLVIYYGFKDIYFYFKYKKFNLYGRTGQLVAYTGLFGKGKTLSAVNLVVNSYLQYNDKIVWSKQLKEFVPQKIKILSNVSLSVPYIELKGLQQIVDDCNSKALYDSVNHTQTITLVLLDEASVQLNCRSFKDNIDPLFLNKLLTCRHFMLSMFYTTQRFEQVDKLLRQVTQAVIDCDKVWRFQRQYLYDAWDMEKATDKNKIKPHRSSCWFVRDSDYEMYDTLACVDNLIKSCKEGDMLSEEEILQSIGEDSSNNEAVLNPSRSLRKLRKK